MSRTQCSQRVGEGKAGPGKRASEAGARGAGLEEAADGLAWALRAGPGRHPRRDSSHSSAQQRGSEDGGLSLRLQSPGGG